MGRELRYPQMHDREYLTETRNLKAKELAAIVGCDTSYVYMQRRQYSINAEVARPYKNTCEWERYGKLRRCQDYDWCKDHWVQGPLKCETMLEWEQ